MPEYDNRNRQYSNKNRGAIWPNDRMRDGKQDPHFTGSLNVDGEEYWVSAWKRKPDAKQGSPSLSFTVNRKQANKAPNPSPPQQPQTSPLADDFDDDVPFALVLPTLLGLTVAAQEIASAVLVV